MTGADRPGRISSGGPYEEIFGYSRAVVAGPWVLVSGCTSVVDGDDTAAQARTALRTALDALRRAGLDAADVVRTRMYVTDIAADGDAVGRVHAEFFGAVRPAATMVEVSALIDPRMRVEIDLTAYRESR
ncbi:MAG: RidA family protein [Actinobacteria bacterium]|nr:RidA family protein [Actinomycetota bacterium]